jgi:hypothetical protein
MFARDGSSAWMATAVARQTVVNAIARAQRWRRMLEHGIHATISELDRQQPAILPMLLKRCRSTGGISDGSWEKP